MDWIRRRPQTAAIAGVVAVLAVLALVYVMASSSGGSPGARSINDLDSTPSTPLPNFGLPSASPSAAPTTAAQASEATKNLFNKVGNGFAGGIDPGAIYQQGIQGGSQYSFLPRHRVVMRVTSAEPIAYVGWVVPTAYPKIKDVVYNIGKSWSLAITAYGSPDYAQIYVTANPSGAPIRCVITVDGRVTADKYTEGPSGRLFPCQG